MTEKKAGETWQNVLQFAGGSGAVLREEAVPQ